MCICIHYMYLFIHIEILSIFINIYTHLSIFMFIYTLIYIYLYIPTYLYLFIYIYTLIYIYLYIYTLTYIYLYTYTCLYLFKYIHTYLYLFIYTLIYIYLYIYTYLYLLIYIKLIIRNWLTQSWRLRNPRTCSQQAEMQTKQWLRSNRSALKTGRLETQKSQHFNLSLKVEKKWCPCPCSQTGRVPLYLWEGQPFCSTQAFHLLNEAHPH